MGSEKKYDVFISYRRNGGEGIARSLYDRLTGRGYSVAYDRESLNAGRYDGQLMRMLYTSKDVVVILDPDVFKRQLPQNGMFQKEIAHALCSEQNVIPLMMDGFEFPKDSSKLPEDIRGLAMKNGVRASMEYFDSAVAKLCRFLKSKPRPPRWLRLFRKLVAFAAIVGAAAFTAFYSRHVPKTDALDGLLYGISRHGTFMNIVLENERQYYESLSLAVQSDDIAAAHRAYSSFTNAMSTISAKEFLIDGKIISNLDGLPVTKADCLSINDEMEKDYDSASLAARVLHVHVLKFGFSHKSDLLKRLLYYKEMYEADAQYTAYGIMSVLRNVPDDKLEAFKNKTVILWTEMPQLHGPWIKDENQLDRLMESAMRKAEKRINDLEHYKDQLESALFKG